MLVRRIFRLFLERLAFAIPTLFVLITLAFFLMRVAPGGPFDTEKTLSPEIKQNIEAMYHLDKPLVLQYGIYLSHILKGDFGPSFQYKDYSVNQLLAAGFPISLTIGGLSIVLAVGVGVFLGLLAAYKQNSWLDYSLMAVSMFGISIPNFVVAPLLILLFAIVFNLLPAGGWVSGSLAHLILPVVSLAIPQMAYVARLMRASMIEILNSPYIKVAKAKGLKMPTILMRHALKPALLPIVSYLGPACAGIVTGSVVIEQIYGIPGLGRFFVQGALNRDYTLVMGVVIFYGSLIITFNFLVDVCYRLIDPRIT